MLMWLARRLGYKPFQERVQEIIDGLRKGAVSLPNTASEDEADERAFDEYDPGERLIFTYHDGTKKVRADPMVLYKKVMASRAELSIDRKVADSPSKDAMTAHGRLVDRIRAIFQLKLFEEGGLTEQETVELLDHFLFFVDEIQKKTNPSPTSWTETSAPSSSAAEDDRRTANTSDCGSTANGSSTAALTPSP